MASAPVVPVGLFDYLAAEERSPFRHEYVGGCIYAMTGGTMRHNRITGNIYSTLLQRLAGSPCQAFINDMKLHALEADSVYYPDVLVVCGRGPAGADKLVTDATLIVEVASESTAGVDRREKRLAYQKLPGLRAYWMVSQEARQVEVLSRTGDGPWGLATISDLMALLPAPGVPGEPLRLGELYVGTDLAAA